MRAISCEIKLAPTPVAAILESHEEAAIELGARVAYRFQLKPVTGHGGLILLPALIKSSPQF